MAVRRFEGYNIINVAVLLSDFEKPDPFRVTASLDGMDAEALRGLKAALQSLNEYRFVYFTDHDDLFKRLSSYRTDIDLVLNLCDKGFRNDWRKEPHVPALLEVIGLPYTGAGLHALVCCFDKMLVCGAAETMQIPIPRSTCGDIRSLNWQGPYPAFVKPNFGDGSFGITRHSVAHDALGIRRAVEVMKEEFGYDDLVLVQEYLPGMELSVGIIGNPPAESVILPILEEDYSSVPADVPHIGCYEAKWDSENAQSPYNGLTWKRAALPPQVENRIVECSLRLFERLECRDYARFDWRLDRSGHPRLLEVNPNPGWDYWTYLATMAEWAGFSYAEMLHNILQSAQRRYGGSLSSGNQSGSRLSG